MAEFALITRGPDRFCPDCGRWLVKVHENGRFDLAAQSAINQEARFAFDPHEGPPEEVEAFILEAICLRCHPEEEERIKETKVTVRHDWPRWLSKLWRNRN